jgi:cytidylate kinase
VDAVALRAQVDIELVESLEAHARLSRAQWWHGVWKGQALSPDDYRRHLGNVVLALSRHGGVIIGHGANLILGPEAAFRVRVTGSLSGRAKRVARYQAIDTDSARERVEAQDVQRRDYLRRLFGAGIDDASGYDLVLNADRWTLQPMTEIVLFALRTARGLSRRAVPVRNIP